MLPVPLSCRKDWSGSGTLTENPSPEIAAKRSGPAPADALMAAVRMFRTPGVPFKMMLPRDHAPQMSWVDIREAGGHCRAASRYCRMRAVSITLIFARASRRQVI